MSDTLLPSNATDLELSLEGATSRITAVPVRARDLANPDVAPLSTLPWLAWGVSVDEWQTDWSEAQKRATIKASNSVHRFKGTIGAVQSSLAALGFQVEIQEWFAQEPLGDPYTFRIRVTSDQVGIPQDGLGKILVVVNNAKNLRSHLDSIDQILTTAATPVMAAAPMFGSEISVSYGGGNLRLDGTWTLDGTYMANGLKIII